MRGKCGEGGSVDIQNRLHWSKDLKALRDLGTSVRQREDPCGVPKAGLCQACLRDSSDACVAGED